MTYRYPHPPTPGDEGSDQPQPPNLPGANPPRPPRPPRPQRQGGGFAQNLVAIVLVLLVGFGVYMWFFVRVVVGPGEVLVLMKKDGGRSVAGDQIIIPREPKPGTSEHEQWSREYAGANGVLEQVQLPGTYFGYSPFDYERFVVKTVDVPLSKVGLVIRKFGEPLKPGQALAGRGQRGPLAELLMPGRYPEYSNPYAYEVKLVNPVQIDPGHAGVITYMAGATPANSNDYLVQAGENGVQSETEPSGFLFVNMYQKRITPISTQSQRFAMDGAGAIRFPSSDSFEIRMEGFVEWRVDPKRLPLTYVQYAEGAELIPFLEEKVILPYSRSFSRLVGSRYSAKDFISGETKLKFQEEFAERLREACAKQGIEIRQALVSDIIPPSQIREPINEREIAKQQIRSLEQQIQVAKSQAELARQTEMASQYQKIGDANRQVVTIIKKAEQERDVALTKARQALAVAKLQLEASRKDAESMFARGQAEANVILLQKQAEAEPLRQEVSAFGDGDAYAQFYFFQQVAPAMKSVLSNVDGPFAELFRQYTQPEKTPVSRGQKITEVRP